MSVFFCWFFYGQKKCKNCTLKKIDVKKIHSDIASKFDNYYKKAIKHDILK